VTRWRWLDELLHPEKKCARVGHAMTHQRRTFAGRTIIFSECVRCDWQPVPNPVEIVPPLPRCIYCGCDEIHACSLPASEGGGPCWWVNSDPPICSHGECQARGRRERLLPPLAAA
jgi:hypothetical protein